MRTSSQEDLVVGAPAHEEATNIYQRYARGESINDIERIDKRIGVAPRGEQDPLLLKRLRIRSTAPRVSIKP
jgi:hypothetical protein